MSQQESGPDYVFIWMASSTLPNVSSLAMSRMCVCLSVCLVLKKEPFLPNELRLPWEIKRMSHPRRWERSTFRDDKNYSAWEPRNFLSYRWVSEWNPGERQEHIQVLESRENQIGHTYLTPQKLQTSCDLYTSLSSLPSLTPLTSGLFSTNNLTQTGFQDHSLKFTFPITNAFTESTKHSPRRSAISWRVIVICVNSSCRWLLSS